MGTEEAMAARQASIGGTFSQLFGRFCAISCWLGILYLPGLLLFGKIDWSWWLVLGEIGLALLLLGLGFWAWSEASAEKADTGRLRRAGRPAVAEVLELEVIDPGDGSHDIARMTLQISGDDVPAFRAIYRVDHDTKLYRVGAHFKAVVDPTDNLFTLRAL